MDVAQHGRLVILVCCLLAVAPLCAQSSGGSAQNSNHTTDKQFLESAGESTLAAIEYSRAVKDRTHTVAVRAFAESVIDDNHQIRQPLLHLASKDGVTLPRDLKTGERSQRMQLDKTPPAQLDEQYARLMVSRDQTAISQFRYEVAEGADPLAKDFARDTLTRLQGELDRAREIAGASRP